MKASLWRWRELLQACHLQHPESGPDISGISIDSRELRAGELFIALSGDPGPAFSTSSVSTRDGHEFIDAAVSNGASALLVSRDQDYGVPSLVVQNTLEGLWDLGRYARQRTGASVIAVTGSAGKTTARHFMESMLRPQGATHASPGSFNNHWGVPLSLARMPRDSRFAVFEIGMNHPGEIVPLSQLARPDVAIVLNVLPAHIGYFSSLDAIRKEKLSIARGLSPEGVLITPVELDVSDWEIQPGQVHHTFGLEKGDAFVTAVDIAGADDTGAENGEIWHVHASILGETVAFELRSGGNHRVLTALASLLAIRAAGGDLQQAGKTLGDIKPPDGRGNEIVIKGITIIDDSYNANPESMRLALEALSRRQIKKGSRKFAMLGEMLELGEDAIRYHQQLADACDGIDRIDAVGEPMKSLMASLKPASKGQWFADAGSMDINEIAGRLQAGDTLLVKGSNKVFWKNQFVQKLIDQLS